MEQRIFNLARRRREGGCAVIAIFTRAAVVVAGIVISRVPTAAAMAAATSIKIKAPDARDKDAELSVGGFRQAERARGE